MKKEVKKVSEIYLERRGNGCYDYGTTPMCSLATHLSEEHIEKLGFPKLNAGEKVKLIIRIEGVYALSRQCYVVVDADGDYIIGEEPIIMNAGNRFSSTKGNYFYLTEGQARMLGLPLVTQGEQYRVTIKDGSFEISERVENIL